MTVTLFTDAVKHGNPNETDSILLLLNIFRAPRATQGKRVQARGVGSVEEFNTEFMLV
jgi:hypothetical protein